MDRTVILGLDVGVRRIGVAWGDDEVRLAAPLEPIVNDGEALDKLAKLIIRMGVSTVVVGLPRNNDGMETQQSKYSRQFADDLADTPLKCVIIKCPESRLYPFRHVIDEDVEEDRTQH